jgi:hypothetical protein
MNGYMASEVSCRALFKFVVLMNSKSRSVSRGEFVETATTKAARWARIKNSLGVSGTPPARGARAGGTGSARGLGAVVRRVGIRDSTS